MWIRREVLGVVAMLAWAAPLPGQEPSEPALVLTSLTISHGEEETGVQVLTDGIVPQFTCSRRILEGYAGLALSFPRAESRLQDSYAARGSHLRLVEVVRTPVEGPAPVEIILHLTGDSFWSLELGEGRIEIVLRKPPLPFEAPAGEGYRVGTGDRLSISVFGHEDLHQVVEVREDGTIPFPLIGSVRVRALTVDAIVEELRNRLARDFIRDPQIAVDVERYQSQSVSVVGEVRDPGRFFLKGTTTLMEILAEAGGLGDDAGSEILVSRTIAAGNPGLEREQIAIRTESLFSRMAPEENLVLAHGDIVNVLRRKYFFIRGEVASPGTYPLDEATTLLKAITLAGGLGNFANREKVEILREVDGREDRIVVNLKAIESRKQEDIPILPEDIINVPRKFL